MGNLTSVSSSYGTDYSTAAVPPTHSRMALVAVANYMTLSPSQVLELRSNCMIGSLGQKRYRPKVSRSSFQKAMVRSHIQQTENRGAADWDIIQQLFTLWEDDEGDDRVDYVEFLSAISPLACRRCGDGDDCDGNNDDYKSLLENVLQFALKVSDVRNTERISQNKLARILNGINATAAYLGDKVLSTQQVEVLADSVFLSLESKKTGEITHEDCAEMLSSHPLVEQFICGLGQYRYVPSVHRFIKDQDAAFVADCDSRSLIVNNKENNNMSVSDLALSDHPANGCDEDNEI